MENDTYEFVCPCCEELLSLDVEGNVTAVDAVEELQPNQRRGIGSLITETNVADRFYQDDYLRNQSPKPTMQPLGTKPVPTPEVITPDLSLMEANQNDLKKRNIK